MHLRAPLLLISALLGAPQTLLATTTDPPLAKGVLPVTAVYVAKGAPDQCGRGCDRWIAVEGKMDNAAAARLRNVLRTQKAANLPIYLHSPGGDVRQALAMGRMLRERKATGRVGRTRVKECGAEGQAEPACLKLKQSGRELEAELSSTGAFCNSACAYLLLGATSREVDPDVTLGVHSARVTMSYRGRTPPPAVREKAAGQAIERLNRDIAGYLVAMGIDRSLLDLAKSVKFEQIHALKRDELVRFGIDKRDVVESSWRFAEHGARSYIDKVVQERTAAKEFRTLRWRFVCRSSPHMLLYYVRSNTSDALTSAVLRFGADQKLIMIAAGRQGQFDVRSTHVSGSMIEKLAIATQISLMEVGKATDSNEPPVRETVLSTEGLPRSVEQLSKVCGY
jgi:hypothetical protein